MYQVEVFGLSHLVTPPVDTNMGLNVGPTKNKVNNAPFGWFGPFPSTGQSYFPFTSTAAPDPTHLSGRTSHKRIRARSPDSVTPCDIGAKLSTTDSINPSTISSPVH